MTAVDTLAGFALDWAVYKSLGALDSFAQWKLEYHWVGCKEYAHDWSRGGPLIERENICLDRLGQSGRGVWCAYIAPDGAFEFGPTPLIAAMRCFVRAQLGDRIDLPKELS